MDKGKVQTVLDIARSFWRTYLATGRSFFFEDLILELNARNVRTEAGQPIKLTPRGGARILSRAYKILESEGNTERWKLLELCGRKKDYAWKK